MRKKLQHFKGHNYNYWWIYTMKKNITKFEEIVHTWEILATISSQISRMQNQSKIHNVLIIFIRDKVSYLSNLVKEIIEKFWLEKSFNFSKKLSELNKKIWENGGNFEKLSNFLFVFWLGISDSFDFYVTTFFHFFWFSKNFYELW